MTKTLVAGVMLSVLGSDTAPARAPAQVPAQAAVTAQELQRAVAALGTRVGTLKDPPPLVSQGPAPPAPPVSARYDAAVRWLQNNAPKTNPSLVTREYVQALERAAAVLGQRSDPAVLEDVTRELEAKVTHCRLLGVGMGGSIALKVNTRRGSAVVGDWQVLYLLKFDDWLKTPPRTFPRVSSPTDARVEPGRYWIWARDPTTGRTSDRVLVEVAGRADLLVDLPVP